MNRLITALFLGCLLSTQARADDKPVAGVIPKTQQPLKIDGALDEWTGAFVTPLNATYVTAALSPTVAKNVVKVAARLLDGEMRIRKAAQTVKITTVADHWTIAKCDIETFDIAPGTYTLLVSGLNAQGGAIVERALRIVLPPSP